MKVKKCKVLFDYKPENEDELELQIGTTVEFHKEVSFIFHRNKLCILIIQISSGSEYFVFHCK